MIQEVSVSTFMVVFECVIFLKTRVDTEGGVAELASDVVLLLLCCCILCSQLSSHQARAREKLSLLQAQTGGDAESPPAAPGQRQFCTPAD